MTANRPGPHDFYYKDQDRLRELEARDSEDMTPDELEEREALLAKEDRLRESMVRMLEQRVRDRERDAQKMPLLKQQVRDLERGAKKMPWSKKGPSLGLVHPTLAASPATGILSAIAVGSLSASMSPSWTELRSIAARGDAQAISEADRGLWVVFGFSSLASALLLLAFTDEIPAVLSAIGAATMLGVGMLGLHGGTPALQQAYGAVVAK